MMIMKAISSVRLSNIILSKFSTWPKFTHTKSSPKTLIKVLHSSEFPLIPISKQ